MGRLAPLSEEPISEEDGLSKRSNSFSSWLRRLQVPLLFQKKSDLKILLSVLGCPLSPFPIPLNHPSSTVASSAQYIIQQFRATTGCPKTDGQAAAAARTMFVAGRVRVVMASPPGEGPAGPHHRGCFVVWQMAPEMWLVELAVDGQQVVAGCDGRTAWRRTPWLGAHSFRGGVRPLRRALQGLDPATIAAVFTPAHHVGEKHIGGEECFALKLDASPAALSGQSDSTAEIIKHVMVGYFSQRSGLLVRLEDSQLTRIQAPGSQAMYWETTTNSSIDDYRPVDGVLISHSGRSVVNLQRFGLGVRPLGVSTRMEESWTIDDVVFNVAGLSTDCFIPPEEIQPSKLVP